MPGLLRKSMLYLGLVDDEEQYADGYGPEPRERRSRRDRGYDEAEYEAYDPGHDAGGYADTSAVGGTTTTLRPVRSRPTAVSFDERATARPARITTLHPHTYNDARAIGEQYRQGTPVIMNLTEMDEADAKRLVDFAAGLTFGLRGTIEKVTRGVFLLSPDGVSVTLDEGAGTVEGGFYNQS